MNNVGFRTGVIKPVEAYKEAWGLIKDQYWLILGITVVGLLIGSAVPVVLIGPMMCGIYLVLLKKLEGKRIEFSELFKGFDYFLPSLVLSIIIMAPVFVMIAGIYAPMIAFALAGPRMSEEELFAFIAGTIAVELIFAVFMVCLHTLLMFAFPLLVDRNLSAVQAIKLSARAVWKNLSGVAGLFLVGFVAAIAGYLVLCIGVYFVIPLIFMAQLVAYRKIFPAPANPELDPPPPVYYRDI